MEVPFLDLRAQDAEVGAAVRAAVAAVLDEQQCVLGPHLERFEAAMARYAGVPHAVGVGSGTDALALVLAGLGVGPGVRVLTTPFTFFATASTIARLGATPVLADIEAETLTLDPHAVVDVLRREPRIAGIVAVHLFGRLARMEELSRVAAAHGCWLVEDAAQAAGARLAGAAAGTIGRAGALSFYPTKNLGGIGDGGMVLTRDDRLAQAVRRDRNQGLVSPYVHETLGLCSRLDAVQAAALAAKLPHLDDWNRRRRRRASWYAERFRAYGLAGHEGAPVRLPTPAGEAHVFHVYCIRTPARDALQAHLAAAGIGTQVYYRLPLHRQPALAARVAVPCGVPESERAAAQALALPMYPQLTEAQVDRVVEAVAAFFARHPVDCR